MTTATQPFVARMQAEHLDATAIAAFVHAYQQLVSGETGFIPEDTIAPVTALPHLAQLDAHTARGQALLAKTVVLRLNGGLGTGMGLDRAKSMLRVRGDDTFLDIVAKQHRHLIAQTGVALPLIFMNSFATDADTRAHLAAYPDVQVRYVLQSKVPKVVADTMQPATWPTNPALEWCPPGHGELYRVLWSSGLLDELLAAGYEYLFSANIDNLGATLEPAVVGYMDAAQIPFLMEVTRRTDADRKGGHLAYATDGRLLLRESAQCPAADMAVFQDIEHHQYFNTNNVWLALRPLRDVLARNGGFLALPIIVNRKTIDVRDAQSPAVIQLESAMGAAIGQIPGSAALAVPRTRFMPVKNCQDLLVLRSNRFVLNDAYHLVQDGSHALPTVQLDQTYYRVVADFEARFPTQVPDLHECTSLTIHGDVTVVAPVRCQGNVVLNASAGAARITTPTVFGDGTHQIRGE